VLQRATSLAAVSKASGVARKEMKKAERAARSGGIALAELLAFEEEPRPKKKNQ
jgi:hypothetical protein